MELRILKYFLIVAREENITKAAEVLHITQPTLSRQLAQMEEELGVQLLVRGKRKITLTEEGMLLRRRADEMIQLLNKTEKELKEQENMIDGVIQIGSGELASSKIIPEVFSKFKEKYPNVTLDVYTGNADQIKERIDQGLLDIGLLLEPVNIEKYDFIRLSTKERWVMIMPKDDPLTQKDDISVDDIKGKPIIVTHRSAVRNEVENWFGDVFKEMDIVATHNLSANAAHLVEKGIGNAIVLEGSVAFYDPEFVVSRPLNPPLESTSVLVWKKNQLFSPTVQKFLNFTKNYLKNNNE